MYILIYVQEVTGRPELNTQCLPQAFSTLFFETGPLIESGAHQLPASKLPGSTCFCLSVLLPHLDFYIGAGEPNPCPYTCTESNLLPEPSSHLWHYLLPPPVIFIFLGSKDWTHGFTLLEKHLLFSLFHFYFLTTLSNRITRRLFSL